jgi:cyclic-di-GMP phosphodiesterase TipF (flagellum assembly factor)
MLLLRCTQLVRKVQRRRAKLGFFCNVSPRTLADQAFFGDFLDFLEHNEALAPNLIFEFAQSDLVRQGETESRHLDRLATLGSRFSVDQVCDPGLDPVALARRRVRFVKVEAEVLLAAAAVQQGAPGRLKGRLARAGIDLIMEKVESEAVLRELLDDEIEYGQGFLFGEPRPARLGE